MRDIDGAAMMHGQKWSRLCLLAALLLSAPARADTIKIGVSKILAYGSVAVARDKGYFAAEGLETSLVYFDSAQPIAVAAVSGDVDFGIAGATAGFYSLAGAGALRIIAGSSREAPGYHSIAFLASNRAYAAGMTSFRDLAGHSMAITQVGTPLHYAIARLAEKYGIELASIRIVALQSNSNVNSALVGGQVDAAAFPVTPATPLIERGDVKLMGWVGDEVPGEPGAVLFTATKTANEKPDTVERFLRAYRKAARDFHDAFTDADGKRKDGPLAPEILAILAKFAGITVAQAALGIPLIDADGRLDEKGILKQIEWYKSQNLLKAQIDGKALIDQRYVIALPEG
jgi:NitT/TauT family transport system substrate-binding protein